MATFSKVLILICVCSINIGSSKAYSADDIINGHLGAITNQLNRDIGDVPGNRYFGDFRFSVHVPPPEKLEVKFDFLAMMNDERLAMYSVPEAYLSRKGILTSYDYLTNSGDQFTIGRQILPWSPVDGLWALGKLNNRINFEFYLPGQEGLVGALYEIQGTSGIFFKVFGSGIFIPELNPSLDIDEDKKTIRSRNSWAKPPARSTEIEGNETPIQYLVDYPETSEIIYRYSLGTSFGFSSEHWFSNLFFMRKPENQLSTQVEVALAEDAASVKAFIDPQIYYHDVFGGNLKYINKDFEAYFGGIAIFPNTFPDGDRQATTYTEIKTEKKREAYLGWGISKVNDNYGVGLNYIARVSPFDRDEDSLVADPRWNQAVNIFLLKAVTRKFKLMGDVKYDMLTTDRLVMLRGGYNVSKELLITLGVNMIGTPDNGKSYWSDFTNNDALYAALHYVF